jgi:hypothetical protein
MQWADVVEGQARAYEGGAVRFCESSSDVSVIIYSSLRRVIVH